MIGTHSNSPVGRWRVSKARAFGGVARLTSSAAHITLMLVLWVAPAFSLDSTEGDSDSSAPSTHPFELQDQSLEDEECPDSEELPFDEHVPEYEFTFSSTRRDTARGNVTETVHVVERREIEDRAVLNCDDLLRTQASTTIRRPQGAANVFPPVMQMRGISGIARTLVLLDGLPLNDALTGAPNLNLLPIERVQRIEVVRGPYSALWGSYAMAGVVNVITQPGGRNQGVTLNAAAGPYDTLNVSATAAQDLAGFEIALWGDIRTSDNYQGFAGEPNLDYNHQRLLTRLDYGRGEDLSISFTGGLFFSGAGFNQYVDLRDSPGLGFYLRNEGRSEKDNQFGRLSTRWRPVAELEFQASLGYHHQWSTFSATPVVLEGVLPPYDLYDSTYIATQWRAELAGRWDLTSWSALVLGVDQVWDLGNWENTRPDQEVVVLGMNSNASTTAGYGQLELNLLSDQLRIIGGARLDRHSTFGLALSPKGGLRLQVLPETTVRVSAGRAFRSPTLFDLYSPLWVRIPPYPTLGNPELEPETLWSIDGGIEQWLPFDTVLRLTGFYVEMDRQITFDLQSDFIERTINSEGLQTAGLESELQLSLSRHIQARLNYTYTWTHDFATQLPVIYIPAHVAGLMLLGRFDLSRWTLSGAFDLSYVGQQDWQNARDPSIRDQVDQRLIGNLRLRGQLGALGLTLDLRNLWDARYEETYGFPVAGFQFLAGIKIDLDSWQLGSDYH